MEILGIVAATVMLASLAPTWLEALIPIVMALLYLWSKET